MKTLRILGMAIISVALCSPMAFAEFNILDFCGANPAEIEKVKMDKRAGVEYSSEIKIPYADVEEQPIRIGVMVRNYGPGTIQFLLGENGLGAWSFKGKHLKTKYRGGVEVKGKGKKYADLARGADFNLIPMKGGKGGSFEFSDGGWGGPLFENTEMTGCTMAQEVNVPKGKGHANLGLSFWRDGKLHTVYVKLKFR